MKFYRFCSIIKRSDGSSQGIYAITGENGSGKSTVISCASFVFYQMPMTEYFGHPNNASIEFSLGDATRKWVLMVKNGMQNHQMRR